MPIPCVVTGNLATLLGGNAAYGYVEFVLGNLGFGTVPRVLGTGIFPALKQVVQTDENGNISAEIWGNDQIDPANTIYFVTFRDSQRNEVGQVQFYINGSSFNLNTAVAASTVFPPVLFQSGNINRILTTLGSPLTSSDFSFSGWGAGATITNIVGTDTAVTFTMTAGASPSMQPTVTLNYHDGSWGRAPLIFTEMSGGTGAITDLPSSSSPTGVTITYDGLPVNGQTYICEILSIGDAPNNAPNTSPVFTGMVLLNPVSTQTIAQPTATGLYVNRFENIRFADQFAGADMGAKINAADLDLGNGPGEIWVPVGTGSTISTPIAIHAGHTLRFIQGGYFVFTAGISLEQGCSIIGSGPWISTVTTSTGTLFFHNFNGDMITYPGGSSGGIGTQGGGVLQNFSIYNIYAGGDLNGRAIVITGTGLFLRTDDVVIDRVYVDGNSATNRWTNGLVIDGTPIGGTDGVRNMTVMNSRFHSCGTNNQDILIKNAFNTVLFNVKITNSNNGAQTPGITITGTAGNISNGAQLIGVNTTNVAMDWAAAVNVEGGFFSAITNTANTGAGITIRPASLTNVFVNNGSAATTAVYPDPTNSGRTIFLGPLSATGTILTAAAPTVAAAQVGFGSTTATSATAGTNGAVPAQVVGYVIINVAGTAMKVPYFNT